MKYKVVSSAESISDLVKQVNDLIAEGWKPQGGVSSTSHIFAALGNEPTMLYIQAMIKE